MLWITGSRGLLGSALLSKCKAALHLDVVATGKEVDVADLRALRAFAKGHRAITHIVNCSAFSEVDKAQSQPEEAFRTNAIGPENLALLAKEMGAHLIHISTDYVFSGPRRVPFTETDLPMPCNVYGKTKLEGEKRALALGACVIRTSWLFGVGGKNFVPKTMEMLRSREEVRLTDDQWSKFTYAPDLSEAILQMLDQRGLFQFANEGVVSRYEFGVALWEEALAMGYKIAAKKVVPVPGSTFAAACERPVYSALDTGKIEKIVPVRPWRAALKDFLCEQLLIYS